MRFRLYLKRLLKNHLKRAAHWARDQIMWNAVFLIASSIIVSLVRKGKNVDWATVGIVFAVYFGFLVIFFVVSFIRAAWKEDELREQEIIGARKVTRELKAQLDALNLDSLPQRTYSLCRDLRRFLKSLRPKQEYIFRSSMDHAEFTEENKVEIERENMMDRGFKRQFADRVHAIYEEFLDDNLSDLKLEQALNCTFIDHDDLLETIIERLAWLATMYEHGLKKQ